MSNLLDCHQCQLEITDISDMEYCVDCQFNYCQKCYVDDQHMQECVKNVMCKKNKCSTPKYRKCNKS